MRLILGVLLIVAGLVFAGMYGYALFETRGASLANETNPFDPTSRVSLALGMVVGIVAAVVGVRMIRTR